MTRTSFSVDERIVFWMRFSVFVRRKDAVECVDPHVVDKFLIRIFISVPVFEDRVSKTITLRLSVSERRSFAMVNFRKNYVLARGIVACAVSPICYSKIFLKQGHHTIDGTFVPTAFDV